MFRLLSFLLLIACITSCNRQTENYSNVPEYALNAQVIATIDPEIASLPEYLALCNDELLVTSGSSHDNALSSFNFNGEFIGSGIKYGQGPDEILEATSLHSISGIPYIYDSRNGNIYQVNTKDEISVVPAVKEQRMHDDAMLAHPYVLIAGTATDNSYTLFDLQGNTRDSLTYFPQAPKKVDHFTHMLACTGHIAFHMDSGSFIRALVYDGGVDFFRINDGKLHHQGRFEIFPMEYSVLPNTNPGLPIPNDHSRSGFIHVATSDNNFYASFSDAKSMDNPSGAAKNIYRFDLDGNLVSIYNLDKGITSFDVMPDDSHIFALSHNPSTDETQLISFFLP